jgi:hypothetical protein
MTAGVQVHLFDRRTGLNLARGTFTIIEKELQRCEVVCLTADSEDGRRISLQIPAQDLEEIPLPPEELSLAGPFRGFRP